MQNVRVFFEEVKNEDGYIVEVRVCFRNGIQKYFDHLFKFYFRGRPLIVGYNLWLEI